MDRLEELKKFLDENYNYNGKKTQTFFCGNWIGDETEEVYNKNGVTVLECSDYGYIEIFGLNEDEEEAIREYGYKN